MQKLDRLVWADGISIHAFGRRIGIRTNAPEVLDRAVERLPPGWEPCCSGLVDHLFSLRVGHNTHPSRLKNFHLLYGGFTLLARSFDLDEVLRALEAHLHLYVGEYASNRVFVHAGVVGWRGRAILLPGVSRSGKSTLVAALLRAGARYYSDEYAVLDPHGLVHPFARPLSIRSADGTSAGRYGPEEFGSRAGTRPLPVAMAAITKYLPGARGRPRSLSTGQAVLALLENTLSAQIDPEGAFRVLHKALASATVVKGPRGEADETAEYLIDALEGARRAGRIAARRQALRGEDP